MFATITYSLQCSAAIVADRYHVVWYSASQEKQLTTGSLHAMGVGRPLNMRTAHFPSSLAQQNLNKRCT